MAVVFRDALDASDKARLPITLQSFPHGACGDAALLLGKFLEHHGFGLFDYMLGQRENRSHAWLQEGGLVVDIAGDQFADNNQKVFVKYGSAWHSSFHAEALHVADYEIYDDYTEDTLSKAYQYVISLVPEAQRPTLHSTGTLANR